MTGLDRLLDPRSVAIFAGRYALPALRQLQRIGYAGRIHMVSPSKAELGGIATVPGVAELPDGIDCAFVAVPAEGCPTLVRQLRERGCGGVVCFTSGFAEAGCPDLQAALVDAAGDMPLLGPNCHGVVNGLGRVALWPDEHGVAPIERGVAILSQSGNIAINFTMQQRSVPIGLVVSLGNQAQLGAAAFLRQFAHDPRITAIGLHLEGIDDPAAFAEAALLAQEAGKPIVVLKTGRSAAGARATVTHTSSLAGSDQVTAALFDRLGIARVDTVAALLETLKLLHVHGRLRGRRICSLSCSGGEAALMADLADAHGLVMPALDPERRDAIEATLDGKVRADNPLDYHTFIWGNGARLAATFTEMLRAEVDAAVLVLDYPTTPDADVASWDVTADAWIQATRATGTTSVVLASLPECLPAERRAHFLAHGIAPLQGLEAGIAALAAASTAPGRGRTIQVERPLLAGPVRQFDEAAGKELLGRAGVPVPAGRVVEHWDAADAADRLGYPVVLKTANPAIAHKSDVGGVVLNLRSRSAVLEAAAGMARLGEEVLVERMAQDVVAELIVGVIREPSFGPVLVLGAGGVLAELLQDSATLLLPADAAEVEAAIDGLRIAALLRGYRGKPAGDLPALVDAVLAIARFATAHGDRLVELDVNPLLVLPAGQGVVAADVLLRMVES